jgi:hypothetical protein
VLKLPYIDKLNMTIQAEIIPDNLHRIMPAKGENTAPPNPFREEE